MTWWRPWRPPSGPYRAVRLHRGIPAAGGNTNNNNKLNFQRNIRTHTRKVGRRSKGTTMDPHIVTAFYLLSFVINNIYQGVKRMIRNED